MMVAKNHYANFMGLIHTAIKLLCCRTYDNKIFGYSSKSALPYAVYLRKAMQLTNILGIFEDYLMDRIYLPTKCRALNIQA
jgi:hypothetical protein